jgi:DHA3 family macrolide efflux protein-like MFS transporter
MNRETRTQLSSMTAFLVLWSGQAVSLLGSQLVQFAIIWWLTQETGSATVLATATLVGLLPQVFLGPLIGTLIDRWNRKLILFCADAATATATMVLIYLFASDAVQIWHIYALLFVRAVGGGFHYPTMMATTALMVPKEHLTRIQGINQMLNGGLNIISAPLGAILLTTLPMQGILAIDVVTALFAIAPLFFIAIPQPKVQVSPDGDGRRSSVWQEMGVGFRYVLGWPGMLILMGMAALINLLLTPAATLTALLVSQHFRGTAIHLAWMEAALGVGVIVGGITLGVWGGFKRRIATSLTGLLIMGAAVIVLGWVPSSLFAVAVGSMFVLGLMMPMTNGPIIAVMQATVAPEVQGRVFTLLNAVAMAMSPLGLIVAGPVADTMGVQFWYMLGGVVCLLMGAFGFFIPALMRLEDGRDGTSQQEVEVAEISTTPAV